MTNKYASQDLYSLGIKEPLSKEELYNLHGITDYRTDATHYNTWYNLTATSWLEVLTYTTLYDSSTEKYFIKGHYNSSELDSCWMTLQDQAAGAFKDENTRWARVSPTSKLSDRPLFKSDIATEVPALQYDPDDTSKPTLYYVHPNYMNTANIGWHTEDELIALGYSLDTFDEVCSPLFFKNTGNTSATVKLKMVGTVNNADYETSSDGISWQPYAVTADPAIITLQPNDRVFFRGRKDVSTEENYIRFALTGHIEAYGNVNSLLSKTSFKNITDLTDYTRAFSRLFYYECRQLYRAPVLPAVKLSNSCYSYMFAWCSNLEVAPELPATILARNCYHAMLERCTKLTTTPNLPAVTLESNCYSQMFDHCTSLTNVSDLCASELKTGCYQYMFRNCTSLVNAPNILAINMASYAMYDMFNGCAHLNNIKCKIITDTLVTHGATNWLNNVSSTGTFYCNDLNCWELDSPNGIPEGWEAFVEMPLCFINKDTSNATIKLSNYITSGGTALAEKEYEYSADSDYTSGNWHAYNFTGNEGETLTIPPNSRVYFKGHRSTQTQYSCMQFETLSGKVYAYGNVNSMCLSDFGTNNSLIDAGAYAFNRMFVNNSYLYRGPSLPATTLTNGCYYDMFNGCSSLTDAPKLPAITLSPYCYASMFYGCISMAKSPVLSASTLLSGSYESMFDGCTSLNEIKCYAINTSASSCTSNMLNSVASNGTFYCEAVPEYIDDGEGYTLEPLPQWYDKNVIPNSWSTVITKEHYTGFLAQDGLPTSMAANTDYQLYWLNDNSNACPLVNTYSKYQSLFADDPDAFTIESIDSSYSPSISVVDSSGNISVRVGTGVSNISKVDYCIDVTNISNH